MAETEGIIHGWKGIAAFFGRAPRTVQEWPRKYGLKVYSLNGRVFAYEVDLEEFRRRRAEPVNGERE